MTSTQHFESWNRFVFETDGVYSDPNVSMHLLLENCHCSLVDIVSTSTISQVQYYPNHASPNLDWFDFDTYEVSENSIKPFQCSNINDNGSQLKSDGSPSPCKSSDKYNTNKIHWRSREIKDLGYLSVLHPPIKYVFPVRKVRLPRYVSPGKLKGNPKLHKENTP